MTEIQESPPPKKGISGGLLYFAGILGAVALLVTNIGALRTASCNAFEIFCGTLGNAGAEPSKNGAAAPGPPLSTHQGIKWEINWIDTGTAADWGGRDYAYTSKSVPKYTAKDVALCDPNKVGYVAICWENRPNGYPNVPLTDIPSGTTPGQWCTYKDNQVKLFMPPDGHAIAGRVYLCAQVLQQ